MNNIREIDVLYHGTTNDSWISGREGAGTLYLTRSRKDAENYAELAGEGEWEEDHEPTGIIAAIGARDLEVLSNLPGVEIHPDWGWVESYEHEQAIIGIHDHKEITWQDSFEACGCISIKGFTVEHKKLFQVMAIFGPDLSLPDEKYKKPNQKSYSQEELEAMDINDLDRLAFGHADEDIAWIDLNKINIIYPGDLENPQYRYEREGAQWVDSVDLSDPVSISIDNDGEYCLEDGHHRYFAAMKRGEKLMATIEIKGNPVKSILEKQGGLKALKREAQSLGM